MSSTFQVRTVSVLPITTMDHGGTEQLTSGSLGNICQVPKATV